MNHIMNMEAPEKGGTIDVGIAPDIANGEVYPDEPKASHLARKLGGKEVQLFSIGGAIGTSVFVTMGPYLARGGPAGLLIAYTLWCMNLWCINESFAEMTVYAPVPGPFITFTAQWVDPALAFSQSWAFFLCEALLVPSEITALHSMITFWTDKFPPEATVVLTLFLYAILNMFSVKWFGKAEFYLSIGKVLLIFLCFGFTFFTMVGCNPLHDVYGFRYWNTPGAFAEYLTTGSLGSFWGTVSCLTLATFAVCGPEYTSSVAGETASPRRTLPGCFKSFKWRLGMFFIGSAICIGIVIPYDDPTLAAFIDGTASGGGTAAASPYTIAMQRLRISGLPHLINAIMMTSIFSCGNGVLYASSRALFTMAKAGHAPRLFGKTTKRGIPIFAVIAVLLIGLLAMMRFNYLCVSVTYLHFYYNLKKQGISRDTLPYKSIFQPYAAYIGAVCSVVAMLILGFDTLHPFAIKWFFLDYTLLAVFPIAALIWKIIKKTKYVFVGTADLGLKGMVNEVDQYEDLVCPKPENWFERIFSGLWDWKDLVVIINKWRN